MGLMQCMGILGIWDHDIVTPGAPTVRMHLKNGARAAFAEREGRQPIFTAVGVHLEDIAVR